MCVYIYSFIYIFIYIIFFLYFSRYFERSTHNWYFFFSLFIIQYRELLLINNSDCNIQTRRAPIQISISFYHLNVYICIYIIYHFLEFFRGIVVNGDDPPFFHVCLIIFLPYCSNHYHDIVSMLSNIILAFFLSFFLSLFLSPYFPFVY